MGWRWRQRRLIVGGRRWFALAIAAVSLLVVVSTGATALMGGHEAAERIATAKDVNGERKRDTPVVKKDEMVFLLHGIGKTSSEMSAMAKGLRRAGYAVVNWNYPSTEFTLSQLAKKLDEQVERFPDYKINFVTHSMGGIVVRTFLVNHKVNNLGRIVMIAPPSKGAVLAEFFGNWPVYKFLMGPAGQELKPGDLGKCECAGVPECEFGIISGGTGRKIGINPLLPGDNDGTVTVESTKLDGARDFALVPYPHPVIQMMPRTIDLTIQFLETGGFHNDEGRER